MTIDWDYWQKYLDESPAQKEANSLWRTRQQDLKLTLKKEVYIMSENNDIAGGFTGYLLTPENKARLERDFVYHAPKGDQPRRYELLRNEAKKLAQLFMENCPPGRELSLALTDLEMAVAHVNMGIARGE